jgi:GTP cyclohydrolase I
VRRLIEYAGEDPNREGLLETPKRFEKAWKFWTSGYGKDPKDIAKAFENPNSGEDGTPEIDQLIVVPKIDYYSMCEHHLALFYGQVHIGYLPNKKVLGLSKFARITDIFARRLQIQERLTQEIANAIMEIVDPLGVAVVVKGIHLCMRSRGVEKQNSEMVTSVMLGKFRQEADLRSEFLSLIH